MLEKYRQRAKDSLLAALKAETAPVRLSAAIALGQMGDESALDSLLDVARTDADENVRCVATLAIGLLDRPAGEAFLTTYQYATARQREAGLIGLGLMSRIEPKNIEGLQKVFDDKDPGLASISAWSLCHRSGPADRPAFLTVLNRTLNPWQANEAILALGRIGDTSSAAMLADILTGGRNSEAVPVVRDLRQRHGDLLMMQQTLRRGGTVNILDYARKRQEWEKMNPNAPAAGQGGAAAATTVAVGLEHIYLDELRASAAIALGGIDAPASRQALLLCLRDPEDGYSQLYQSQAVMSLGLLGEPAAVKPLLGLLGRTNDTGGLKSRDKLLSPLRGHAALALGLHCRPASSPQGPVDRPGYAEVRLALAKRLADAEEQQEVRAACALALGLSGRVENLTFLQQVTSTLQARDDVLVGYVILARAMLADRTVLDVARRYLDKANDKMETNAVLGRRAAVLGLGLLGTQEAIPLLTQAWELNHHVNREIALSLALCEAYNATDPLIDLMTKSPNPWQRAFAARCLGEIFVKSRPQRLALLNNGGNYMIKNSRMFAIRAMGNEFLYTRLLEDFGEKWR